MFLKRIIALVMLISVTLYGETDSITIGVAPHSSPRIILESHEDLRIFLENYFKRPARIVTAKNFSEFAIRTNQGKLYDLVLTSPNLALLAKKEASYAPIMTYTKGLSTIILGKDKDILKSKKLPLRVVGLDPVSFVTLNAEEWLEKQGLNEGEEIVYSYSSASDSAAAILMNNGADISVMSLPNYLKLPEDVKQKVHILYQSPPQASRIYLAKNGNNITLKMWQDALKQFMNSKDGLKHLQATKLEGFKILDRHELDGLERIANKTLKRLETNQ